MGVAAAHAVALEGATGHVVDVQADVSPGSAGFTMVGRADLALREGVDRCRTAVVNSGLTWPVTKRITVLLSPADLAKDRTETVDLSAKHPDKVKELEKLWLAKQDEFIKDANLDRSPKKKK